MHNKEIENFQRNLNAFPPKNSVKVNPMANNSKYLPIGYVESILDEYFSGIWSVENFKWEVVHNEIVGSIDLKVFHPVIKEWITRTGAASVMAQVKRGAEPTIENKIKNTLVKDFPHLKAECVKNAAKTLGSIFGRNLNREDDMEYRGVSEIIAKLSENQVKALELLANSTISEKETKTFEDKIKRSTPSVLDQIITYLQNKQNG